MTKLGGLPCFLALALSVGVSVSSATISTNSAVVSPFPMQIVTCREDVDVDALLQEFQLSPRFIYRAINGFAAQFDGATIRALQVDGRVLAVEADGQSCRTSCSPQ